MVKDIKSNTTVLDSKPRILSVKNTKPFTSKVSGETKWDYTKLLLHLNGTDGGTTLTDSSHSNHSVTAVGNAQLDTAQSKFGGASGLFDGTGDYLTVPDSADFAFGDGNFTIDFWLRFNATSGTQFFFDHYTNDNNRQLFYSSGTGGEYRNIIGGIVKTDLSVADFGFVAGNWYHIAIVRNGNVWTMYKNGTSIATVTETTTFPDYTGNFTIGAYYDGSSGFNGWIDEFRISKGVARWTANFTPPTAEYVPTE